MVTSECFFDPEEVPEEVRETWGLMVKSDGVGLSLINDQKKSIKVFTRRSSFTKINSMLR